MRERRGAPREQSARLWWWRVAAATLAAGIILIPIVYIGGVIDAFREPKEALFRGEAIVLLLIGAFAATSPAIGWRAVVTGLRRREWLLLAAIVGWSAITTLTSVNRSVSAASIVTLLATIAIYVTTRIVGRAMPHWALLVAFVGAAVNTVVVTLQEHGIWNPFRFPAGVTDHMQSVGLLGNPNDVGTLLVGPAIVALAATAVLRGRWRVAYGLAALVLFVGIAESRTRTALIALGAGVLVLALRRPWRQAVAVILALVVGTGIVLRAGTPLRAQFEQLVTAARTRNYPLLFSERAVPFLSAIEMIRAHPITGVGPGCFANQFMATRVALGRRYPPEWTRGWPMNFGETHNDHLQIAAETGLPGYALCCAALLLLAIPARRRTGAGADPPERLVARATRGPLVATFVVLAIAQFPLHLASARLMFVTLAALAVSWDDVDA